MSSNDFDSNSDRTVFRQPSVNSDRTVVKPTPGGRAKPSYERHAASQPVPPTAQQQQAPIPPRLDTEAAYFQTTHGLNPLVNAASVLIAVFEKTKQAVSHPDIGGLHQRLVNEIKSFEKRAKEQGIASEIVLSARYILCTILDEAVLNTPWGCESAWHQRSLLSLFHNETSGGEKFYILLDRLRQSPAENLDILELFYICLSVGFEGQYRLSPRGKESIEQLRGELFNIIRTHRGEYERALSQNWQGLGRIKNSMAQYIPTWVVASIVGAILLTSYSGFRYWLYDSSVPVVSKLEKIIRVDEMATKVNRTQ